MFFIVGIGRSGSTLLQTILDAHRNVVVPPESKIIIYLYSTYLGIKDWTPTVISNFVNDLYTEAKFRVIWGVKKEELASILMNTKDLNFIKAIQIVYTLYDTPFDKEEIQIIGDKNPVYAHLVPELVELFPKAKFIHLIREYHANVESHMRLTPKIKLKTHAIRWVKLNEHIEEVKAKYPDNFLLVKYEDLVTNTGQEIQKIFEFLEVPIEDSSLDYFQGFNSRLQRMKENSPLQWKLITTVHPNLLKPINSSRLDFWKSALNEKQLKTIESISGEAGKKYGYEPVYSNVKPASTWTINRLIYFVWHHFIRIYYRIPLKTRTRLGLVGDSRINIKNIVVE